MEILGLYLATGCTLACFIEDHPFILVVLCWPLFIKF